jgi:hypothetical protein
MLRFLGFSYSFMVIGWPMRHHVPGAVSGEESRWEAGELGVGFMNACLMSNSKSWGFDFFSH